MRENIMALKDGSGLDGAVGEHIFRSAGEMLKCSVDGLAANMRIAEEKELGLLRKLTEDDMAIGGDFAGGSRGKELRGNERCPFRI